MEGYSDSVIPSLAEFSPPSVVAGDAIDEKGSTSRKGDRPKDKGKESNQRERERREKMTEMFSVLQSIVPNLLPKATKEKIVADTIRYIQRLEKEREKLEKLSKTLSPESEAARDPTLTPCTRRNPTVNVNVTVSGDGVVFFGIQLVSRRRHLATEVFRVFEKHHAEVLAASVSIDGGSVHQRQLVMTVTATALAGGNGESVWKIKREIQNL
ncbi:hypothetical protein U1Q18_031020 [Sarracenia purpurea var. burkii]